MRHLTTLALVGLFGGLLFASDASACHKTKCACPAPAPVCAPAPKACHFKMPKMHMPKMSLCHKKATACPTYETYSAAPMMAPMTSPQTSMQSM